jgi:hypothetical protein
MMNYFLLSSVWENFVEISKFDLNLFHHVSQLEDIEFTYEKIQKKKKVFFKHTYTKYLVM